MQSQTHTYMPATSNPPLNFLFVPDPSESPLLEISLSCDNLLCDALGRAPSARLVVHARNPPEILWRKLAQTEVAEVSQTARRSLRTNALASKLARVYVVTTKTSIPSIQSIFLYPQIPT